MDANRINLQPADLDSLLLDSDPAERAESIMMLQAQSDMRDDNDMWAARDRAEDALIRSWS
jgi:hypothetical protein